MSEFREMRRKRQQLTEVKEIIHDYNLLRPSEKQKAREILKGVTIGDNVTIGAGRL